MLKHVSHQAAHRAVRPKPRLLTGLGLVAGVAALVLAGSAGTASSTEVAAGSWRSAPPQVLTSTTTSTTISNVYQTAVRAPINADGSSNFSAKRGVIPVQLDLLKGTSSVTTTTKTYSPFVWESVARDTSTTNDYAFADFEPTTAIPLADLSLSAVYDFTTGTNGGGSLRWTLEVDWTGDGSADGSVDVFYGTAPGFVDDGAQSGVDMRTLDDLRVDTTHAGGTFYDNWDGLAALHPSAAVTSASLIMDAGWKQPGDVQRATVTNVTVNGNVFAPKPTTDVTVSDPVLSPLAKTCDLPLAGIRVVKGDNVADGAVNEAESIQPKDAGTYFRQVDCKYIYNLDVSRLSGSGTYRVYATFDGVPAEAPARFDLR